MHQPVELKRYTCRGCEADVTIKGWYCFCVPCTLKMEAMMTKDVTSWGICVRHGKFLHRIGKGNPTNWCPKCDEG